MSMQHPIISFDVAISHQDDLLSQAETKRLVGTAETNGSGVLCDLKRSVGQALVRLGEHLQMGHRRAKAGDLGAAAGALRLSR
jgi:hypothetical protein